MRKRRSPSASIVWLLCIALFTTLVTFTVAWDKVSTKFSIGPLAVPSSSSCLDRCRIKGLVVDCTRGRARCKMIPYNTPNETKQLIMTGNQIKRIKSFSFANLTKLEFLDLTNCKISIIESGAFRWLTELSVLNLSYNRYMRKVDSDFFNSLANLSVLNLTASRLFHSGHLFNLRHVKYLYLVQNQLSTFSRCIDHLNNTLLPRIEVLNLEDNNIEHLEQTELLGLESLRELRLTGNRLLSIMNNTFLSLPGLITLRLNKNFNLVPEKLSFASLSLRMLSLSDVTPKVDLSSDIYEGMPNLEQLRLANSRRLYKAAIPFSSLSNLVELNLRGVGIRAVHLVNITKNLPKLRRLDLSDNERSHMRASFFRNLELDILLLRRNWISTISKTTFTHSMWSRLKEVDFSENPYFCDCKMVWLRQWLRNKTRATAVRNKGRMVCIGPHDAKNIKLYLLSKPTREECFADENDYYRLAVLLFTLVIWFLAPLLSIVHRYRWFLKYYYFKYKVGGSGGST